MAALVSPNTDTVPACTPHACPHLKPLLQNRNNTDPLRKAAHANAGALLTVALHTKSPWFTCPSHDRRATHAPTPPHWPLPKPLVGSDVNPGTSDTRRHILSMCPYELQQPPRANRGAAPHTKHCSTWKPSPWPIQRPTGRRPRRELALLLKPAAFQARPSLPWPAPPSPYPFLLGRPHHLEARMW